MRSKLDDMLDALLLDAIRGGSRHYTFNTGKPMDGNLRFEDASLSHRAARDAFDRITGHYRPSPVADEAETGVIIEGTCRRK